MTDRINEVLDRIEAQQAQASAEGEPPSALEYVRDVYKGRRVADPWKMRAAMAALPFESPKLSAMAIVERSDFATMLDKAIERSGKGAEVKQIEAQPERVRRREVTS
mgnify:CR=1 FL=1